MYMKGDELREFLDGLPNSPAMDYMRELKEFIDQMHKLTTPKPHTAPLSADALAIRVQDFYFAIRDRMDRSKEYSRLLALTACFGSRSFLLFHAFLHH